MTRHVLSHTADTGLEATAPTFEALLVELATGMFELMGTTDCVAPGSGVTTSVNSATKEDLVVDVLSDLLYLSETEDLHLCDFEVRSTTETAVTVRARGVPVADVEPEGPPIKAVTYHRLQVVCQDGSWYGRVYFDV